MLWLPEGWCTLEDAANEYSVISGMQVMDIEMKRAGGNPKSGSSVQPSKGTRSRKEKAQIVEQATAPVEHDWWDTSTMYGTIEFLKKRKEQRAVERGAVQVENMDSGEIYYALASYVEHCTKCHMVARQNNPQLAPQMVNGAPTVVSMDHELLMPIDAFIGKRWMDPPPSASVKDTSDHTKSRVRFNFAVFESETTSGMDASVKRGVPKTWPQDDINDHRRSLYKYPVSEESARCSVTVSSMALQQQMRDLGLPVFEGGRFVKNCSQEIRSKDTFKPDNINEWHRTNRYRFEVARLWWKLFMDQPEEVRGIIFHNCSMAENVQMKAHVPQRAKMKDTMASIKSAMVRAYKEGSVSMILSVIELGDKGLLMPGSVVPKFESASEEEVDSNGKKTTSLKFVKAQNGDTPYAKEMESLQPVQLWKSMTWPVVMPGKTTSWLDWSVNNNVICGRNMMAYTVLEGLFGDDVASDYDTLWQERDEKRITPGIRRIMDSVRSLGGEQTTSELLDAVWDATMIVFDDLVDAMPFWANAHLSMDMVNDPEAFMKDAEKVTVISTELQTNADSIEAAKRSLEGESDPNQVAVTQATLRELEINYANLKYMLRMHGADRNAAEMEWLPYASENTQFLIRSDADVPHSETWAQEQLHRSILDISVSEEDDRITTGYSCQEDVITEKGKKPTIEFLPRNAFGKRIQEGSESAAAWYRQWYWEVHKDMKDNGLGMSGQQVTPLEEEGALFDVLGGPKDLQEAFAAGVKSIAQQGAGNKFAK